MRRQTIAGLFALILGCGTPEGEPEGDWLDLTINEFLASNDTTIPNELGDYVDWIELYNSGEVDLSTAGLYISDDIDEPGRHPLPELTIPAGGHLLLWADKEAALGDYHLPFALEKSGESIALSYLDDGGEHTLLDAVTFGEQTTDLSQSRIPDGGDWTEQTPPTPGMMN